MKRRQIRILGLLALANVIIIGVLGVAVWRSLRSTDAPVALTNPCANLVLQRLPRRLSPTAAWEPDVLYISLTASYDVPTPPEASAQLLWVTLDSLPDVVTAGCDIPPEVRLTVLAKGEEATITHLAYLDGATITAWSTGEITEAELRSQATYAHIDTP